MRVEENKIKPLVLQFQETSEKEVFKEIIMAASDMIYHYPLIVFHKDIDQCSEFYIYFIEKFHKLLHKYDPSLSSFNTWFNIVLKSQCINWMNTRARKEKKKVKTVSMDTDQQHNEVAFVESIHQLQDNSTRDIISQSINKLNDFDQMLIRLLYFNIDDHLLRSLSSFNKRSLQDNISLIQDFLNN
ncbi:MAG: sigma-70 family RNA polymerase sigma factor, partial [Spirochaetes bacterium]|nr:sigma-70 family RNA polymerase sigma factor [Spirochaetota bacterium]